MARSSNALPFITLGVVVVAAAFGVGYYVLGGPRPTAQSVVAPPPTPVQQTPAPVKSVVPRATVRTQNTNYTAPGAPAIQITEDPTPTIKRVTRPAVSAPDTAADSEASQQATPAAPTPDIAPVSSDNPAPAPDSTSSPDSNTTPSSTSPSSAPTAPADPDFEQTGSKTPPAASSDSESSQQAPKATFRVQTGSFAAPQNAKALADALRQRGYVTSTRAEQDGGRTVYKVQIGAYRTKAAADKAALDLQKDGYPAYSSPITP